ncbi:uncharacterized protein BCR38DRAFT_405314 [Pseudomassariella vexata]|uniref:Uncharacterized protein n=1 Tax=Pseudomassariella vexata TaxID=1141098 RepID=A0A1Y2EDF6_9PEZI|nr:uncharacterized protein BCR38DRAFT_405314 [Pseudomassariella vexata]ORY69609.1 hypothetical protein BCR38DRAFT_405314 [Pseudomassariella vexata]
MALLNHPTIFRSLAALGFCLVWGVMAVNGSLGTLLETITTGVFPDGRVLKAEYTGVWFIDYLLCILVVFFDSLLSAADPAPYLMLLELVATLFVVNMMTLVEGRRPGGSTWLQHPAIWQYAWNCGGVAVFLPIWVLLYVKQGSAVASRLSAAHVQALPFTAIWSLLLVLPLTLPPLVGASPSQVQIGIVIFFLTPPLFVGCQSFLRSIFSRTLSPSLSQRNTKPIGTSYLIAGIASALVHVGIVYRANFSSSTDTSLDRIFFPHYNAVQLHRPDTLSNGALLFIQYDYVLMSLTILLLGIHIHCLDPATKDMRATQFVLAFQLE